jgi:hypothetical protein
LVVYELLTQYDVNKWMHWSSWYKDILYRITHLKLYPWKYCKLF